MEMSEPNLMETCAWLDALYGHCCEEDGEIVIVAPSRCELVGVFRVGNGRRLVKAAIKMHENPGCYLKINLMDSSKMKQRAKETGKRVVVGNREEIKSVVSFHLDIDAGKKGYMSRSAALWSLEQLHKPTLLINSKGSTGGFHAYWIFKKPILVEDRTAIQVAAYQWQEKLKAVFSGKIDSTANIDRILRCVGVPRTDGGEVSCEYYDRDRLYDLADLK
jgi:hypothetical protein